MKMNARLLESLKDIFIITDRILIELENDLFNHLEFLYKLSDSVGTLDFIISCAAYAAESHINCRPNFGSNLIIEDGFNPILLFLKSDTISNSLNVTGGGRVQVVSGANMCGKTTLLRQIGLLQVMCQAGFLVPAQRMTTTLMGNISCRMGSDDDLESNASSFTFEMREIGRMLEMADEQTLLLIDELGRGTSIREGTSLAISIIEELILKRSFVLISTHLPGLKDFASLSPNVRTLYFKSMIHPNGLSHLHKIEPGEDNLEGYGLSIAHQYGLPERLMEKAKEVYKLLTCKSETEELIEQSMKKKKLLKELDEEEMDKVFQEENSIFCDFILQNENGNESQFE
jgi:DNA mismatch repair protein MSH4